MAEKTKIAWTDHTFNPWIGCAKVNEGCKFCYAENLMANRYGRVVWGPNGTRSKTNTWKDLLKWNRQAVEAGNRRKVFCASLADVFEDWTGPILSAKKQIIPGYSMDDMRSELFKLIDQTPALYWLLLTKRPENIVRMWPDNEWRENVWLGTSIANQKNADEYIDRLLAARFLSPILFLSVEPQIDFVDLRPWLDPEPLIHWVIVGGESQQGSDDARPFQIEWAEALAYQCAVAGIPCFVKQLGSNVVWHDFGQRKRRLRLRDSHGGDMVEWPERLRVRQCPEMFFGKVLNRS